MEPIAILGAGSMGQLWAGYLPAGSAVFVGRLPSPRPDTPGEADTFDYRVRHPEGSEILASVAVQPISSIRPTLLLVTTKAGDTPDALAGVLPNLSADVPVVLFQNGMGCQQLIAERWRNRPVLAASTTEGANRPQAGLLVHAGWGETWVGGLTASGQQYVAKAVERLAGSGLVVHAEADIHQRLWDKLVVNAGINAFTAILDCPNGDIVNDPFFLTHIDGLCEEVSNVMASQVRHPLSADQIKKRIYAVASSTSKNTSSMRSDRQRGKSTEIDVINGYICDQGRIVDIPTPVNQMLTQQVKDLSYP